VKKTRLSPLQKAKRDVRIAEAKLRIAKRVLRENELEEDDEIEDVSLRRRDLRENLKRPF